MPDNPVALMQSEAVGESVGEMLRSNSFYAVLFSILAILLYIAFRFWSVAFGLGAVVSLVHDTVVMLGACMFLNIEISMVVIGAILALLGYSNNDTIVNFSQIRKNIKQMRGASLYDIINTSINQMLRRTIMTSAATSLVVLAMLIFGGEVLRDFSLIFLVGIIFGTYSSIYIASPVVMWFYKES
jgi:preprotein translocase SecF subunit